MNESRVDAVRFFAFDSPSSAVGGVFTRRSRGVICFPSLWMSVRSSFLDSHRRTHLWREQRLSLRRNIVAQFVRPMCSAVISVSRSPGVQLPACRPVGIGNHPVSGRKQTVRVPSRIRSISSASPNRGFLECCMRLARSPCARMRRRRWPERFLAGTRRN